MCPDWGLRSGLDIGGRPAIFTASQGSVEVLAVPGGRFRVTLKPHDPGMFIPRASCETSLPPGVIAAFLDKSFAWLCESLARHDDPEYVSKVLGTQLFAYFDPSDFRGKRLLDFGCGSGASTLSMAAMLPETEIVGVELNPRNVELARRVLAVRRLPNVEFLFSPDSNSLPAGMGAFDFVMLSAVYEHLLPEERRRVMPLIWASMNYGAVLFVNQTPYRYFPVEHHSTGLWFINYLPDRLSLWLARKFSRINPEGNRSPDWNAHLRGGIRGATEREVLRNLQRSAGARASIIQPKCQDRARYWLSRTNTERYRLLRKCVAGLFGITDELWGSIPSMNLDVAIRKDAA